MSDQYIENIIQFSLDHPWQPKYSTPQVRRFLTELISSPDLVFAIRDGNGLVAAAVLIDKISNPSNDASLEILGIRAGADVSALLIQLLNLAKERTPEHRSGFQVSLSPRPQLTDEQIKQIGLTHYYDTYEMRRPDLKKIPPGAWPQIVKATPEDSLIAYKVMCESFAQNIETHIPDIENWRSRFLASTKSHFYFWREGTKILGFLSLLEEENGDTEVRMLGVLPSARSKGIGQKLLTHGLQRSSELGHKTSHLTVAVTNQKALGIYLRAGFKVTEEFKVYRAALRAPMLH